MRVIEFKHRTSQIGVMTEYFIPYTSKILKEVLRDEWLRSAVERGERRKNSFFKFVKKYRLESTIDIRVLPDVGKEDSGLWINDPSYIDEFSLWDYMADIESVLTYHGGQRSDDYCNELSRRALLSRRMQKRLKLIVSLLIYLDGNDYLDEEAAVPWLYRAQMISMLYRIQGIDIPDSERLDQICQDDDAYAEVKMHTIMNIIDIWIKRYREAKEQFYMLIDRDGLGGVGEGDALDCDIETILNICDDVYQGHFGEGCFALFDGGVNRRFYSFSGIRELNHSYKSLRVITFKLMLALGTEYILAELDDETITDTTPVLVSDRYDESRYVAEVVYFGDAYGELDDRRDSYNKRELSLIRGTFSGFIQKLAAHKYAGEHLAGNLYYIGQPGWKIRRIVERAMTKGTLTQISYDKGWKGRG